MRGLPILLLPLLLAQSMAQFGGFGGLSNFGGNVANTVQQGVGSISGSLKSVPLVSNVKNFADFVAQTGKTYADTAERQIREGLFASRQKLVEATNAATDTYQLAINAFADLTNAEFIKQLTGNKKSASGEAKAKKSRQTAKPGAATSIPNSFDWRQKGAVTPVKFQGECGSCWSFATTGAIEGHVFRKTGKLPTLSEQNLIDCGPIEFGLNGCDGGYQEYAFDFIKDQQGIANGEKYPYLDKKSTCQYKDSIKAASVTGFAVVKPKDEKTMKEVIATLGPLACSVNALETLMLYDKNIYNDEECNKGEVNHAVLVVGYGSENGLDYWIVKNSWGKNWGEDGYFRLPRGSNFCGIAEECSYPLI